MTNSFWHGAKRNFCCSSVKGLRIADSVKNDKFDSVFGVLDAKPNDNCRFVTDKLKEVFVIIYGTLTICEESI